MTDLLIVGAGLTGATIARLAHDAGISVSVVERRDEIGGNLRDWRHPESDWLIHRHGPHFFRTSSPKIWQFVNRFAHFRRFEATVQTSIRGNLAPWPPSRPWLDRNYGPTQPITDKPANFREACLNLMPRAAYEDCVAGYVEKQWAVDPATLSADLAKRFEIRNTEGDCRLKTHTWQGLPNGGYGNLVAMMLRGIPVETSTDGRGMRGKRLTVFTGPIDEHFGFRLGRLRYRSQRREHHWYPGNRQIGDSTCVVYPGLADGPHVRDTEWSTVLPWSPVATGTLISRETPCDPESMNDLEYPMPGEADQALYQRYVELGKSEVPNVLFAGRLGQYRYLDMDACIGNAMNAFKNSVAPRCFPNPSQDIPPARPTRTA